MFFHGSELTSVFVVTCFISKRFSALAALFWKSCLLYTVREKSNELEVESEIWKRKKKLLVCFLQRFRFIFQCEYVDPTIFNSLNTVRDFFFAPLKSNVAIYKRVGINGHKLLSRLNWRVQAKSCRVLSLFLTLFKWLIHTLKWLTIGSNYIPIDNVSSGKSINRFGSRFLDRTKKNPTQFSLPTQQGKHHWC